MLKLESLGIKMLNKKPINVYWAPCWIDIPQNNWNLLYPDPEQLYKNLSKKRAKETAPTDNLLQCPAVNTKFRNTYLFTTSVDSQITIDNDNVYSVFPDQLKRNGIAAKIQRTPSFKNNKLVVVMLSWIFFTDEESLDATFTPPYFHQTEIQKYGAPIPGTFDIGKWFRSYTYEVNLWDNVNQLNIKENDPLFYAEFITDRSVNIQRFEMNEKLFALANAGGNSSVYLGALKPLSKRYEQFAQSRNKDIIIKEIKKQIVGEK
jgi:hypothetical protein